MSFAKVFCEQCIDCTWTKSGNLRPKAYISHLLNNRHFARANTIAPICSRPLLWLCTQQNTPLRVAYRYTHLIMVIAQVVGLKEWTSNKQRGAFMVIWWRDWGLKLRHVIIDDLAWRCTFFTLLLKFLILSTDISCQPAPGIMQKHTYNLSVMYLLSLCDIHWRHVSESSSSIHSGSSSPVSSVPLEITIRIPPVYSVITCLPCRSHNQYVGGRGREIDTYNWPVHDA